MASQPQTSTAALPHHMPPQLPHWSSLAPQNASSGQLVASSQEDPPQQQFAPEGAGAGVVGAGGGVGAGAGVVGAGGAGGGGAGVVVVPATHLSWQPCTQAANTAGFVGQPAMHAPREPPGQSPDGGAGAGACVVVALWGEGGEGLGVGTGAGQLVSTALAASCLTW